MLTEKGRNGAADRGIWSRVCSWQTRAAAFEASLLVFLIAGALVGAVVYTLDRNARRSSEQQASTELASGSRVAAANFSALRANLRARAGQIAASLELQEAVIARDSAALKRIAAARHARIVLDGHAVGKLAPAPRMSSTAAIANGNNVLARVEIAVSLDRDLIGTIRNMTPLPAEEALILMQHERVVAGGPRGADATIRNGRVTFGSTAFVAREARVGIPRTSILAVEPVRSISALALPYRRRLFLAALVTLMLAAIVAARLGRPAARLLKDVARLSGQAQTDSLTGLANRRFLDEQIAVELRQAAEVSANVGFIIADVDNFKQVNDRYGHTTGDRILQCVAVALRDALRECDLAARWGGEEFAVVLPRTPLEGACRTAERLREEISGIVVTSPSGELVRVTASFGVAAFPTFANVGDLVQAADHAMYEAKRAGKDGVVVAAGSTESAGDPPKIPVLA